MSVCVSLVCSTGLTVHMCACVSTRGLMVSSNLSKGVHKGGGESQFKIHLCMVVHLHFSNKAYILCTVVFGLVQHCTKG